MSQPFHVKPKPHSGDKSQDALVPSSAQAAYTTWGYRNVGVSRAWDEAPLYDCMLREMD